MSDLTIDGSPAQCREAARQLRDAQRVYERVETVLGEVADDSSGAWQGIAAEGYRLALREQRARAGSLALVTRELAAGLDLLADGLDAARADMDRARAALDAVGIPLGDSLPPRFVIAAIAAEPDAALTAYERAQGFVALARTVEASAQQTWYAVVSGVLRELGTGPPPVVIDEDEPDEGFFGGIPGVDRLEDWLPSMPELPDLPSIGLPFGPVPTPDLRDLAGTLKWLAVDGNPVVAGGREFFDQLLEDSGREDLGLAERLARAGLVGWTTYAGGAGAGVVCAKFAPTVIPACTKAGVAGGRWVGNWLVDRADAH